MKRLTVIFPLALLSRAAWPCTCAEEGPDPAPADGAEGVPLSVSPLLVYAFGSAGDVTLSSVEGSVPGRVEIVPSSGHVDHVFFRPDAPLDPLTAYVLSDSTYDFGFTTGDGSAEGAVATPVIASTESYAWRAHEVECGIIEESSCGSTASVRLVLDDAEDDRFYEIRTTAGGEVFTTWSANAFITVGTGMCFDAVPAMLDADEVTVELRALDLAGNASDWTAPVDIALDWPVDATCPPVDDAGAGCGVLAGGSWWLALLPLALRRRRR